MELSNCSKHKMIDHFAPLEKVIARITFLGAFGVGGIGILLENTLLGVGYLLIVVIGMTLMARHLFCIYCPYPVQYKDCLFFPVWFIGKNKHPEKKAMNTRERLMTFLLLGGLILIPQYFLIQRPIFLGIFWVFSIYTVIRASFYLCKRCRYIRCPLNRVQKGHIAA